MSDLRENFLAADKTVPADRSALDDIYREHEGAYLDSLIEGNQVSLEWRKILTDIGVKICLLFLFCIKCEILLNKTFNNSGKVCFTNKHARHKLKSGFVQL